MDLDRFERISELFEGARPLAGDARHEFLNRQCSGDTQLRDEVIALLKHHDESSGVMQQSAVAGWSGVGETIVLGPRAQVELPERIGKYRIRELIGEGGFGVVYRAQQDHPRRDVALKVLRPALATPRILKRFEIEGETLGRLHHPGIASIYESGTEKIAGQTVAYMAMEFVDGCPLTDFAQQRPLGTRERLSIFIDVCQAVHYAHQRGVIHRDLKPANILVSDEATKQRSDEGKGAPDTPPVAASLHRSVALPKVLDFGVARVTDADVQATTLHTGMGQLIGTLAYMSPEQLSGDPQQIDTRSDVYSLGVVLFELITDRLPREVQVTSIPEAVEALRNADPARMSRTSPLLKGDLQTIVAKALAREPARRYQSANDLGEDVRRYLAGDAISARRDSTWYVFRKTLRRHRLAFSVASLFILLVTLSTVVLAVLLQRQTQLLADVTEAKGVADERFDQVRRLAHTFMFDFHDRVARLPGSTETREFLVKTALEYLERLSEDAGADSTLLSDLAEGYVRIGDVQGHPGGSNLGDVEGALQSYQLALAILRRAEEESPEEANLQLKIAVALLGQADMLQMLGRTAEGNAEVLSARDRLLELQRRHPDDLAVLRELGLAHLKYGAGLARIGQLQEGLAEQETALKILRENQDRPGVTARDRRDFSLALLYLGDRMTDVGDARRALDYYQQSLAVREALVAADPFNAIDRRAVAVAWTRIGNVQGNPLQRRPHLGDVDASAESYARGMEVFKELFDADPKDARAVRDLSIAYEKLGDIERVREQYAESLNHYVKMLDLNYTYLNLDRENRAARNDLITSEARVGLSYALNGRRQEAMDLMERALKTAQGVRDDNPEVPEHDYHIGWVCNRYGEVFETLAQNGATNPDQIISDWKNAADWYQKGLDQYQSMRARGLWLSSNDEVFEGCVESVRRCKAKLESQPATGSP